MGDGSRTSSTTVPEIASPSKKEGGCDADRLRARSLSVRSLFLYFSVYVCSVRAGDVSKAETAPEVCDSDDDIGRDVSDGEVAAAVAIVLQIMLR